MQSLDEEFTDLVHRFSDYLEENNTSVKCLKKYIGIPPGYIAPSISPLWQRLKPELKQTTEISDFFEMINSNIWNFLDYQMLEYLIKKFKVSDLSDDLKKYVAKINNFKRTTSVIQFIDCWDGHKIDNIPESVRELIIECDIKEDITSLTLAHLDDLRHEILRKCLPLLAHFACVMYYNTFSKGCLCVSWLFPERFSLILKNKIQDMFTMLEKYHIVWVKIDEECIYLQDSSRRSGKLIYI